MTKITFTGDIIIAPEQLQAITKNADGNFSTIFEPIASLLKESDFVVGNLETPLGGKNLGYTNHKWSFNTPDELADALREIGFNMLTTANNHCLDRDKEGLVRTIHCLDRYGLDHIGTYATKEERDMVYIKRFGNLKIAFLSYTYGTNAAFNKHYLEKEQYYVNMFQPQEVLSKQDRIHRFINVLFRIFHGITLYTFHSISYKKKVLQDIVRSKEKGADFIFMCMHAGGQYNLLPDRYTCNLMRFLLNTPLDMVIGHHPHCIQHIVKKKNKVGIFSLGDFCPYPKCASAELASPDVFPEYSIVIHVYLDENKVATNSFLQKKTFTIVKSIIGKDKIARVYPLYRLIELEKDSKKKQELINDNNTIVSRFLNCKTISYRIMKEYNIQ